MKRTILLLVLSMTFCAAHDRAAACTVHAAVPALRTDLDGALPVDGGLLFTLEPYDASAPPIGALSIVRGAERIDLVREEIESGALVYRPASAPTVGRWRLEGYGEPRPISFEEIAPLDRPADLAIRRWESGRLLSTWHERLSYRAAPTGVALVQLRWRFGASSWIARVEGGQRGFSFRGEDPIVPVVDPSWEFGGCSEIAHGPSSVSIERGAVAQARWIDRWGRASAWSPTTRVAGRR